MLEYFANNMWLTWILVALVCLIAELSSGDMFLLCFAVGAVFGIIPATMGLGFVPQLIVFVIFSVLSIFFVRPVALRYLHRKEEERLSNADALIGRVGEVTEQIAAGDSGRVRIDGDYWKAVSTEKTEIPVGEKVKVVSMESTIITVERIEV